MTAPPADEERVFHAINAAFAEGERLEKIFSLFRSDSCVSRLNAAPLDTPVNVSPEFTVMVKRALELWQLSGGAFNPFSPTPLALSGEAYEVSENGGRHMVRKMTALKLDLNGVAKGFIVDQMCESLMRDLPTVAGGVNGGGDLRFFNSSAPRKLALRLGGEATVTRALAVEDHGVATSQPRIAFHDTRSSTRYPLPLRKPLSADHAAVAVGHRCWIADALTKVALFGAPSKIAECCRHYEAKILLFDAQGTLCESYGGS